MEEGRGASGGECSEEQWTNKGRGDVLQIGSSDGATSRGENDGLLDAPSHLLDQAVDLGLHPRVSIVVINVG